MFESYRYPISEYGGRVAMMDVLETRTSKLGYQTVPFAGVSFNTVKKMREAVLISELDLQQNDAIPPNQIINDLESILFEGLCETSLEHGGPVIKASYLSNNCPNELSFAGVGSTVIAKNERRVGECIYKVIKESEKPYSNYYRQSHSEISSRDMGLLVMGFLPKQIAWGTAWVGNTGVVIEVYNSANYQEITHISIDSRYSYRESDFPWICNCDIFHSELKKLLTGIYGFGIPSDIEFCIGYDGLKITQWRPIPAISLLKLEQNLRCGFRTICPPPYSEDMKISGRLRKLDFSAEDPSLSQLLVSANSRLDEIWVISYTSSNQIVGLFNLLNIASLAKKQIPPVVVILDSKQMWRHLHAVASEENMITRLAYSTPELYSEVKDLPDGTFIKVENDHNGYSIFMAANRIGG